MPLTNRLTKEWKSDGPVGPGCPLGSGKLYVLVQSAWGPQTRPFVDELARQWRRKAAAVNVTLRRL
jgi:hypothetical protein